MHDILIKPKIDIIHEMFLTSTQPAITTLGQGVKHAQSW